MTREVRGDRIFLSICSKSASSMSIVEINCIWSHISHIAQITVTTRTSVVRSLWWNHNGMVTPAGFQHTDNLNAEFAVFNLLEVFQTCDDVHFVSKSLARSER